MSAGTCKLYFTLDSCWCDLLQLDGLIHKEIVCGNSNEITWKLQNSKENTHIYEAKFDPNLEMSTVHELAKEAAEYLYSCICIYFQDYYPNLELPTFEYKLD